MSSSFLFFFLFLSSPIYIHICIGPTKLSQRKDLSSTSTPSSLTKIFFDIHFANTRTRRYVREKAVGVWDRHYRIREFRSVLGNPKKYTYSLYVRDILSEIAPNSTYWITQLKKSHYIFRTLMLLVPGWNLPVTFTGEVQSRRTHF